MTRVHLISTPNEFSRLGELTRRLVRRQSPPGGGIASHSVDSTEWTDSAESCDDP